MAGLIVLLMALGIAFGIGRTVWLRDRRLDAVADVVVMHGDTGRMVPVAYVPAPTHWQDKDLNLRPYDADAFERVLKRFDDHDETS